MTVEDDPDRRSRRIELGVPDAAASCHTALVAGYAVEGLVADADRSDDPLWVLVLVAVLTLAVVAWMWWMRLETTVDAEAVHVRFRGLFVRRRFLFADIDHFEAVTYRPVAEYGGWGIRWRGRGKIAYSVSGKEGVRLTLADGKDVMIGSQKAAELEAAMQSWVRR